MYKWWTILEMRILNKELEKKQFIPVYKIIKNLEQTLINRTYYAIRNKVNKEIKKK